MNEYMRQHFHLFYRDEAVQGLEEQAKVFAAELVQFCEKRLPKLVELGLAEKVAAPGE